MKLRDWINVQVQAPDARAALRRKLAKHLGIKPQGVGHWYAGLRPIPPRYGLGIQKFTNGDISAEQVIRDYQAHIAATKAPAQRRVGP